MQVKVERKSLLNVVSKVKLAVASKSTLPLCSFFKLEAGQGRLTITGGNMEHFLIGSCEGKVLKVGAVCVQAKPFEAFLRASSADEVRLTGTVEKKEEPGVDYKYNAETQKTDEVPVTRTRKVVSFKAEVGAATATIEANNAADYPPTPQVKSKPLTITAFDQVIDRVGYAMATEDNRPVLHGLCLRQQGRKIEAVAADGFQLAIASVEAGGKLKDDLIIPFDSVMLIKRLFKDYTLRYSKEGEIGPVCLIEGEGLTMVLRLTTGAFPDYPRLIPKGGVTVTADTSEIAEAVKLALVSQPGANAIRLQTLKRKLVVSARSEDNTTEVRVKARGKIQIAFDPKYLQNLLSQAGDTITLRTTTPSAPAVMKTANSTHVVMPYSVQW